MILIFNNNNIDNSNNNNNNNNNNNLLYKKSVAILIYCISEMSSNITSLVTRCYINRLADYQRTRQSQMTNGLGLFIASES